MNCIALRIRLSARKLGPLVPFHLRQVFLTWTLNLSVKDICFSEFTIPSLNDFVDRKREDMLLCLIRAIKQYQFRTEQYCPAYSNRFVFTG